MIRALPFFLMWILFACSNPEEEREAERREAEVKALELRVERAKSELDSLKSEAAKFRRTLDSLDMGR